MLADIAATIKDRELMARYEADGLAVLLGDHKLKTCAGMSLRSLVGRTGCLEVARIARQFMGAAPNA